MIKKVKASRSEKIIHNIALYTFVIEFDVSKPTAQVNITRDITLGFINSIKDFI